MGMGDPFVRKLTFEACEGRLMLAADGLYRPIDGLASNPDHPDWGAADAQLVRLTSVAYDDGISSPAGADRPSARAVSNAVVAQDASLINARFLTDFVWQWGQFLDHDLDLTEAADPAEPFPITVPAGDPDFDPFATGTEIIELNRSTYDSTTGTSIANPRQQLNQITSFIDASNVYGSDAVRADALRSHVGGRLETSADDLLPFNTDGLPNAGGDSPDMFLGGDVRANEQVGLTAMHTLLVREHNRLADEIAGEDYAGADLSDPAVDESIYQRARALVGAQMQAITYNEFLPALLGYASMTPYAGYDPTVNPGISNVFATAGYRLGHSMLSTEILRLDASGVPIAAGNLALRDAFFAPSEIVDHGIDPLLRGLAAQTMQEVDTLLVDDVRNFLFGPPGSGGFDLASLNVQRGRDHGLPGYNQVRIDLGLSPVSAFGDISSNPDTAAALASVYDNVEQVDVWVGALAEDHMFGASVGELTYTILMDQFQRLRDGDPYWYELVCTAEEIAEIHQTTLSDIIQRNTGITGLRDNVFLDESVMYYRSTPDGPAQVNLRSDGNTVWLTDGDGNLVDQRAQDTTTAIVLVAMPGGADPEMTIYVDCQVPIDVAGQIMIAGGANADTHLILAGGNRRDQVHVERDYVEVNTTRVDRAGTERLTIKALDGNDFVQIHDAGGARVAVDGGRGRDRLIGSDADEFFWGGDDRDTIRAGSGNDFVFGGGGDDRLYGQRGDDMLVGGAGNDVIVGHGGNDLLSGGSGADTLRAGGGRDVMVDAQNTPIIRRDEGAPDSSISHWMAWETLWLAYSTQAEQDELAADMALLDL